MKKLVALLALAGSVFAFAPAASFAAPEDDHGKHEGRYSTAMTMMTMATGTITASTKGL